MKIEVEEEEFQSQGFKLIERNIEGEAPREKGKSQREKFGKFRQALRRQEGKIDWKKGGQSEKQGDMKYK